MDELEAIASKPTCIHQFLLHDFEEVESLKYAIEERTCKGTCVMSRHVLRHITDACTQC